LGVTSRYQGLGGVQFGGNTSRDHS
jgi:hypothetical protein